MKKLMKRKLTSLATGELVAVLVFWMNFFPAQKMDSYYWSFDFYFFLLVCTEFYSDTGLCFLVAFDKKDFQSKIC